MTGPAVRRIVTGHDARGRAVIVDDAALPVTPIPSGDAGFALLWATPRVPADNDDPADGRDHAAGLALDAGTVLRIVDMLPGGTSPMHRTSSIDYGIVLSGEVDLLLDDGLRRRARTGDVIVQRGTIHAWHNPSADEICRIAFILVGAKPVTVNGEALPPIHP